MAKPRESKPEAKKQRAEIQPEIKEPAKKSKVASEKRGPDKLNFVTILQVGRIKADGRWSGKRRFVRRPK